MAKVFGHVYGQTSDRVLCQYIADGYNAEISQILILKSNPKVNNIAYRLVIVVENIFVEGNFVVETQTHFL